MADWNKPDLLSTESEYTDEIKARDEDLAKQFDGVSASNLPEGTIRWNSVNKLWEKLVSGIWQALCDVYNIVVSRAQQADNADKLDGYDSSQFLRSDTDDVFSGNHLTVEKNLHVGSGYSGNYLSVPRIKLNAPSSSWDQRIESAGIVRLLPDTDNSGDGYVEIHYPLGTVPIKLDAANKRILIDGNVV